MAAKTEARARRLALGATALLACAGCLPAQTRLPATAPTGTTGPAIPPLAAVATPADTGGARHHRAQVSCAGGQLLVRSDNSSLNGILRQISSCTGMKITGGVVDQRVFGNYGPAAPATVIATLLDGTGANMVLLETADNRPSELILTPRTGGPTPPNPSQVPDTDMETASAGTNAGYPARVSQPVAPAYASGVGAAQGRTQPAYPPGYNAAANTIGGAQGGGTAVQPGAAGPADTASGPPSLPLPTNNVLGSPSNTSPNAGTYPTTNSVPLNSIPTPSTTPWVSGIVTAPNPPPPGSDTAALLNGRTTNQPGATTIVPAPTSSSSAPGATNTSGPAAAQPGASPTGGALTPQQVYDQLRQMQAQQLQQQQQRQNQGNQPPAQAPTTTPAPQ